MRDTTKELSLAMEAERARRTDRLAALLTDLDRHRRWLTLSIPDDLREELRATTIRLTEEIAASLLSWRDLGGQVVLSDLPVGAIDVPAVPGDAPAVPGDAPEPPREEPAPPREAPPVACEAPVPPPASTRAPMSAPSAPSAPSASVPPSAPASPVDIASLKLHFGRAGARAAPEAPPGWTSVLDAALRDLQHGSDVDADFERLQRVVDARESWKGLPQQTTVRLIELVAARLRGMQAAGLSERQVEATFATMSAFSREAQPGFAWGLKRDHTPKTGSWAGDAAAALQDLGGARPERAPARAPNAGKSFDTLQALVAELGTAPAEALDAVYTHIRRTVSHLRATGVNDRDARLLRILADVADDALPGPEFKQLRAAARATRPPEAPAVGPSQGHSAQGDPSQADPTADAAPTEAAGFATVLDALRQAEADHGAQLVVWRTARDSAALSGFGRPQAVYDALAAIAALAAAYHAPETRGGIGPWIAWFEQRGFKYAAQESPSTMNLHGKSRTFTFQGQTRTMARHLTLGGGDRKNCLQIYFDTDDVGRTFVIGYCGAHLPYAGQNT